MPYIVAKYLALKLVNLLIWCRFFLEKLWFLVFGFFGGDGEAVGYWLLAIGRCFRHCEERSNPRVGGNYKPNFSLAKSVTLMMKKIYRSVKKGYSSSFTFSLSKSKYMRRVFRGRWETPIPIYLASNLSSLIRYWKPFFS